MCSRVVILLEGEQVASDTVGGLRDLLQQPSLEEVFTRLAVRRDVRRVASELIEAMKL